MSSSPDNTPQPASPSAEYQSKVKEISRDNRLSFRNFAEHQLRREFKDLAIEKCRDTVNAFGKCAQENGLGVVFYCREENKRMNECLHVYNSHEAFEKYKAENKVLLDKRVIKG